MNRVELTMEDIWVRVSLKGNLWWNECRIKLNICLSSKAISKKLATLLDKKSGLTAGKKQDKQKWDRAGPVFVFSLTMVNM